MRAILCAASILIWAGAIVAQPVSEAPAVAFLDEAQPPAPDYARPDAWAARGSFEGVAALVPPNAMPRRTEPSADVFYIHPTTYLSKTRWNQHIDDVATNAWTDTSVVARQASAFNACCRIYAPRYRQASLRAFGAMAGDGGKAYALGYDDVLRAFDYYMAHDNHGRPFILVGHSQGALDLFKLLHDRIDGTSASRRLIAAYVLGYGLVDGDFGTALKKLKPCTAPGQTGCVISWNSFLEGSDATAYARRAAERYVVTHGNGPGARLVCSDPLELGGAHRDTGTGALPDSTAASLPSLVPGAVTTRCDADGVLKVRLAPSLTLAPLPGGNMHYHDVALFYADIRADAARRVAAFR